MEAAAAGPAISATWAEAGIDFSSLPRPQALYLLANRAELESSAISFRGCTELVCILNRYHGGDDDNQAGVLAYWWYLKTGAAFTVSGSPPIHTSRRDRLTCAPGASSFAEHRFSPDELRTFVQIVRALPTAFLEQLRLSRLYRYRRNFSPLGNCPAEPMAHSCGVPTSSECRSAACAYTALGGLDDRFILFTDNCLTLSGNYRNGFEPFLPPLPGSAWVSITHELGHLVDQGLVTDPPFSPEWLRLSGYESSEAVDPATGENIVRIQRIPGGTRPPVVTPYARSSSSEDLAETIAYFRFNPHFTQTQTPEKARFVSAHFYGGRDYTENGLGQSYRESALGAVRSQLSEIVQGCPSESCISTRVREKLANALNALKLTELEACSYLRTHSSEIIQQAWVALAPDLAALRRHRSEVSDALLAERELSEILRTGVDVREIFQFCLEPSSAETCFETRLQETFDRVALAYSTRMGERLPALRAHYLSEHSASATAEETRLGYFSWFSEAVPRLEEDGTLLWLRCTSETTLNGPVPTPPRISPFSGGSRYVDARILDCINARAGSLLDATRDRALGMDHSLDTEGARTFVRERVLGPPLLARLNQLLQAAVQDEELRVAHLRSQVQTALHTRHRAGSEARALATCRSRLLSGTLPRESLRFHSFDELIGSWVDEICGKRT